MRHEMYCQLDCDNGPLNCFFFFSSGNIGQSSGCTDTMEPSGGPVSDLQTGNAPWPLVPAHHWGPSSSKPLSP